MHNTMKNCLQTLALLATVTFFAACGSTNESATTSQDADTLAPQTEAPMMSEPTPMPTDTVMADTMQVDSL